MTVTPINAAANIGQDLPYDKRIAMMSVINEANGIGMNTPLDSDLLRTFVAIAETGNFTKAAVHVGRTQSAVSMQMKRLEDTSAMRCSSAARVAYG